MKRRRKKPPTSQQRSLRRCEVTKAKIGRYVKKWRDALWLGQWQIDTVYEWQGIDDPASDNNTMAQCSADWRYMYARLRFDLPLCREKSDGELEVIVVHELMHCIVNEMRARGLPHEERVVSHLTRVVSMLWSTRRKP